MESESVLNIEHEAVPPSSQIKNGDESSIPPSEICNDGEAALASKSQERNVEDEKNPYAYLRLDGFSSEKFKIELLDLPKIYGYIVG